MNDEQLKPCPFCGGEASIGTIKYDAEFVAKQNWNQDVFYFVSCVLCSASTQQVTGAKTEADAASKWNRRYEDTEVKR